jgi:hypothetical protein
MYEMPSYLFVLLLNSNCIYQLEILETPEPLALLVHQEPTVCFLVLAIRVIVICWYNCTGATGDKGLQGATGATGDAGLKASSLAIQQYILCLTLRLPTFIGCQGCSRSQGCKKDLYRIGFSPD